MYLRPYAFSAHHLCLGPVDASKTVFIDQTAVVIVTKGLYSAIKVIPRDSFENAATISEEKLTVEIRKVIQVLHNVYDTCVRLRTCACVHVTCACHVCMSHARTCVHLHTVHDTCVHLHVCMYMLCVVIKTQY